MKTLIIAILAMFIVVKATISVVGGAIESTHSAQFQHTSNIEKGI